jgi:hypothetical protein
MSSITSTLVTSAPIGKPTKKAFAVKLPACA